MTQKIPSQPVELSESDQKKASLLMLWLHQDQTCQTKPCQTKPDGARWSQTKKMLFLSGFLDQTFPGIFGDRLCQTAPDFFVRVLNRRNRLACVWRPGCQGSRQERTKKVWLRLAWFCLARLVLV